MGDYILAMLFLGLGGISIWFSKQKRYYEKTAEAQGASVAKRKFRIIRLCGYVLLAGGVTFSLFIVFGI